MANDKMTKIAIKFTRMFCTSFSSSCDRLQYLQYATTKIANAIDIADLGAYHIFYNC